MAIFEAEFLRSTICACFAIFRVFYSVLGAPLGTWSKGAVDGCYAAYLGLKCAAFKALLRGVELGFFFF